MGRFAHKVATSKLRWAKAATAVERLKAKLAGTTSRRAAKVYRRRLDKAIQASARTKSRMKRTKARFRKKMDKDQEKVELVTRARRKVSKAKAGMAKSVSKTRK